jgi:bifunctional non-homologous end joining protein LigD
MLATLVQEPFHRAGWVYEEKYDGYRIVAYKEGEEVTLRSRNDRDRTAAFAPVAAAIRALRPVTLLLDGEVVAFDAQGVSRFQLLQQGAPGLAFAAFDCLYADGRDLRGELLAVRRAALEEAIEGGARLFASRRLAADGGVAYERARARGLEGLIAKDGQAPYIPGRSRRWLKVKVRAAEELVIGGFTAPAGSRRYFGALLLGAYEGDALRYVGKAGTGFTQEALAALHRRFRPLVRRQSPFVPPPRVPGATWLAPRLVAQVAFREWTADHRLRQPVFLGLRDDKAPEDCRLPQAVR